MRGNGAVLPLEHKQVGQGISVEAEAKLLRDPDLVHRADNHVQEAAGREAEGGAGGHFQVRERVREDHPD